MQRTFVLFCIFMLSLGLFTSFAADQTGSLIVSIVVSPSTINIQSEGVWVTVHADIPYSQVADVGVTLNGVDVVFTKADARGDFVAKFDVDQIKEIVEPGMAELTLSGVTVSGEDFRGSDTVRVIDEAGTGR